MLGLYKVQVSHNIIPISQVQSPLAVPKIKYLVNFCKVILFTEVTKPASWHPIWGIFPNWLISTILALALP